LTTIHTFLFPFERLSAPSLKVRVKEERKIVGRHFPHPVPDIFIRHRYRHRRVVLVAFIVARNSRIIQNGRRGREEVPRTALTY